jgi:tetratricopeptide (TPR) repeat protein
MATLTVLRVFFAGPRDVDDERRAFRQVAELEDRRVAENLGFKVEPRGCEDTMPGCGRPQELINKDVDECNLFVLSLFMRWGTPTGEYSAGVEEEFERALQRRNATGEPEIWLFFRDIAEDRLVDPGDQLKKVLAFRDRVESQRLLLHQAYRDPAHWAAMFGDFLSRWLFETKARGGPGPGDRLPALPPPREPGPRSEYITSTADLQAEIERLTGEVETVATKLREASMEMVVQAWEMEGQGRVTEAEAVFVRALDLCDTPEGHNDLGVFLARLGRRREAASQFELACELERDPIRLYNWGNALTELARGLWWTGEWEEARRLYQEGFERYGQAVAVKPDMQEALNSWGNALTDLAKGLWQAGEREEARRMYEEGLERYRQGGVRHYRETLSTIMGSFRGAGDKLTPDLERFFLGAGVPREFVAELPRPAHAVEFYSCFISYGHPDFDFARRLWADLEANGVSCWLYALDATPGERLWTEIDRARRQADKMVVICSGRALIRDGVLKEIEVQMDEDPRKIVPISRDDLWGQPEFRVVRGSRDIGPFLRERNYADFSDDSRYEESLQRLLKALRRKAD